MGPDQIAPIMLLWEQSDLGPYCTQYCLPKNISRQAEQMTSRGLNINIIYLALISYCFAKRVLVS